MLTISTVKNDLTHFKWFYPVISWDVPDTALFIWGIDMFEVTEELASMNSMNEITNWEYVQS